jgi:hypothetical protein
MTHEERWAAFIEDLLENTQKYKDPLLELASIASLGARRCGLLLGARVNQSRRGWATVNECSHRGPMTSRPSKATVLRC